jgi:hypothetical protein
MPLGVVLNLDRYEVVNERHGVIRRINGGATVTLKGNAVRLGKPDLSIDGYVFTRVAADFWAEWLKTHADSSLLADGFIKPAATVDAANKIAREHEKERGQNPRLIEGDERTRGLGVKKFDAKDDAQAA